MTVEVTRSVEEVTTNGDPFEVSVTATADTDSLTMLLEGVSNQSAVTITNVSSRTSGTEIITQGDGWMASITEADTSTLELTYTVEVTPTADSIRLGGTVVTTADEIDTGETAVTVTTDTTTTTSTPSDSTTPSPSDSTTPSPSDSTTPTPTDSTTPSPSDTTTPSPSDTTTSTPTATSGDGASGFGVSAAIASLGGVGYWLYRRLNLQSDSPDE